jgi:hypothetical protein
VACAPPSLRCAPGLLCFQGSGMCPCSGATGRTEVLPSRLSCCFELQPQACYVDLRHLLGQAVAACHPLPCSFRVVMASLLDSAMTKSNSRHSVSKYQDPHGVASKGCIFASQRRMTLCSAKPHGQCNPVWRGALCECADFGSGCCNSSAGDNCMQGCLDFLGMLAASRREIGRWSAVCQQRVVDTPQLLEC